MNEWWWVKLGAPDPVGPLSPELVLEGIRAGKLPVGALVCQVGAHDWKPIDEVPLFAGAVRTTRAASPLLDENEEPTLVEALSLVRPDTVLPPGSLDDDEQRLTDIGAPPSEPTR